MTRGKSITHYFFVLLLIFLSNKQVSVVPEPSLFEAPAITRIVSSDLSKPVVNTNSHPVKNDRIRIRYMGGESPFVAGVFPLMMRIPESKDRPGANHYLSRIFSNRPVSFQLRGPPVLNAENRIA